MDQYKKFRLHDEFCKGSRQDFIDLNISVKLRERYFNIELDLEYSEAVLKYPKPELSRISPLSAYGGIFLNTTFFKVYQNDLTTKMVEELMMDNSELDIISNLTPQSYREKILLSLIMISDN